MISPKNLILVTGALLLTAASALHAQPANDLFANAWTLTGGSVTTNGNSNLATEEANEPNHGGFPGGRSVWFNWVAPTNVTVRIDTAGSGFNTLLGVYTGTSVSALTVIASNNDFPGLGNASRVEFPAVAGTTYRIAVDGRGGFTGQNPASGPYVLNLLTLASVFITSPANGSVVTNGNPLTIDVEASVPNPPITRVDVYRDATLAGTDAAAPYQFTIAQPPLGTNNYVAVAVDSAGLSWTSAVVRVAVLDAGITIVSPTDGAGYAGVLPATITINAVGLIPSGTLTNVEFLVDGIPIAEDAAAPYSGIWSAVTPGVHRLNAIGRADNGVSYASAPIFIALAETLIPMNSVWRFLDNGSDQGVAWKPLDFDDILWKEGPAELGYGDGGEATVVEDNGTPGYNAADTDRYITTYFRRTFSISNAAAFSQLFFTVLRDDAAVVHLNGAEVSRSSNLPPAPTEITYTTLATGQGIEDVTEGFGRTATTLVDGTNILAVEIHQQSQGSSDISFNLQLQGLPRIIRNQPPLVALVDPTNNANLFAPTLVTLDATALDSDGTVTGVEFLVDGVKIGEDTTADPQGHYTFGWTSPPIGPHILTAVATDNQGAKAESAVTVHVYDATGSPFARIISPANGTVTEGPTNLAITASATAVSPLTNIAFYAGTTLIGNSTEPGLPPHPNLKADYEFQNTLSSTVGTPPALANLGPNTFGSSTVDGQNRTVLRFAQNDGVSLPSSIIPQNVYTIAILFSFSDITSWRRIIDFKDTVTDDGLYSYHGALQFYPFATGAPNAIPSNTFVQVVLTRDSSKNVTGYVNGTEQFSFIDSTDDGAANPGGLLRFFRDNGIEGSAGSVARIRIYDAALSSGDVAGLDRLPAVAVEGAYSIVWNAPFGAHVLTAVAFDDTGRRGTSAPVNITISIPPTNTVPPTVAGQLPAAAANLTNLTSVQVIFSERVQGVNASDLLVNGVPAIGMTGSLSNYTFTFPQPIYGTVSITWANGHGITDFGYPSNLPFDQNGTGATWTYNLIDRTAPFIISRTPNAGLTITNLSQITVTFNEAVTGIEASDLLVNGVPALSFSGTAANYVFTFAQPASGPVAITWAGAHGISDLASSPNAFDGAGPGATWGYTLDARTILVHSNSTWRFIKGLAEASTPIDAWRQRAFDDSSWSNALAPFYYGDPYPTPGNPGTLLSDMLGGYSSIYLRQRFTVGNAAAVTNLLLAHQSDDGFIAWINGVEVFRFNMAAGDIPYNGSAPNSIQEPQNNGAIYINVTLPDPAGYIVEGENVLTVHGFNNQPQTSSDFGFNAQLYTYLADPTVVPPRISQVTPNAGTLFYLTNITVRFTEPVTGVNASDLLINGVPATGMVSTTNTTYTFSFGQPAYGSIAITWAAAHDIVDFDTPAKAFDGTAPGSTFQYSLLNPSVPVIASQTPSANATINNLTQITINFDEPVAGVDASDLLINGVAAGAVTGGGATYTFTFAQPGYGAISIGWAVNHNIVDLDVPANAFEPARVGSTWGYTLVDQTAPSIVSINPPAGSQVTNVTQATITFSEPVAGVDASDLRINGAPAAMVSGAGAVYTFTFAQPNATSVNFTWAPTHGIRDLAPSPNAFDAGAPGSTWSYSTPDTLAPTLVSIDPPPHVTVRSLTRIQITFSEPVAGVDTNSLLINGQPVRQLSGSGAGPYTFSFPAPTNGAVEVRWSSLHHITDLAEPPNPFAGGEWNYILDPTAVFAGKVLINEIMFNPLGGAISNEWIELRNVSTGSVNVTGWHFTRGVDFTLPNVSIQPSGYLVVAANLAAFQEKYPGVSNVVGGWTGRLANSEETIEIETALGEVVNSVHYASEGDWARRERGHGAQPVTGITLIGSTATVTVFGHGFTGNDRIMISGADQPEYNGIFTINNVGPSTFNINNIPGTPAPATGNLIARQVIDDGASGWSWFTPADGFGSSLELVNRARPNTAGQNWLASSTLHGTPGRANSTDTNNIAPIVQELRHVPSIPRSTDLVTINARVLDEAAISNVQLFYRDHTATGPAAFGSTNMFDDGAHSDGAAADGLFGAVLPAMGHGTIMEFYVQATDATGLTRTWPAPAWDTNNTFGQLANAYYQVDDESITNLMPTVRVVMSATERATYQGINRNSDAEMNVTMIATDGSDTQVRYLGGVRVRGAGSRSRTPPNNRLNLANDNPWKDLSALNLNGQFVHAQMMGGAVARKAGLAGSDARVVQYRMNGVNPAPINAPVNGSGNGAGYGTFIMVQPVNGDLADDLYPEDGDGNVYRASTGNHSADLSYRGTNPTDYITRGYFKTSNRTENDWADLMNLTFAFGQVADADFVQAISSNVNVRAWMTYFAVGTLINFGETSLFNGRGDDYALYRGVNDPRFVVIGHDFDTVFGQGDTLDNPPGTGYYPLRTNAMLHVMLNPPNTGPFNTPNVPLLRRFFTNEHFAPVYFSELKRLCDTVFSPNELNPLFDQLLSDWGNGPTTVTIEAMKTHAQNRRSVVLSQIPLTLTVNHSLGSSNGLPYTTATAAALSGVAHAIETRRVLVNGVQANWSAFDARWTHNVSLQPGINRVLVQSLNSNGVEFARSTVDIWYDDGAATTVSGAIATDTIWSAAQGPYQVTANVTVNPGATLRIQAGTTVHLAPGTGITVANGGRILAEGTDTARIRFTRVSGGGNWGGIVINGGAGSPESRIAYADIEGNGSTAIDVNGGDLFLSHCTFANTAVRYLDLDGASFVVEDCHFPNATASFEPIHGTQGIKAGGRGIIQRCFVGRARGYNDNIDFTGGNRPGPVLQVINNVFMGSDDDLLDLDSTDAWIQGNIFLHTHRNGSPDSASGVSGGADNADTSQVTIIGNLFYDVDHAALAKQGNFFTLLNNTIVHQTKIGSEDTNTAVVILADDGTAQGVGMYLEGNIIYDAENLTRNVTTAQVTYTNNIIAQLTGTPWGGAGGNNSTANPLLKNIPPFSETTNFNSWAAAQVMWDYFSLNSGSPGIGTGPNGHDKGGVIPLGVSISGEPAGTTPFDTTTLLVGLNRTGSGIPAGGFPNGSGFTHYRWRLDGGVWSAETPISTPLTLNGLSAGPHFVEVSGRNDAGLYQDDPAFGAASLPTLSRTWTVNPNASPLRLNEILASNGGSLNHNGTTPDAIEIFNASDSPVNLAGMRLTDDLLNPDKFIFPAGATLLARSNLVVFANNPDGTPGYHLGFNLNQITDSVYLYDSALNGGALIDSVAFGLQITDLSIGRLADGQWGLTQPTFGAANVPARTGDSRALRINEWLAFVAAPSSDFIELYNTSALPVALGGLFFTDELVGNPLRHEIAPLSFMPGFGYRRFFADSNPQLGTDHLNFSLSGDQGEIGLFFGDLTAIDCVFYQPQRLNISQGRSPNGSPTIVLFDTPTPGAPNPLITSTPLGGALVINEVLAANSSLVEAGRTPDWVEFYNGSTNLVDLGGRSLTDTTLEPLRFVFPAGTMLAPATYLRVLCDPNSTQTGPLINTNFALSSAGGGVFLFDSPANGGGLLNSIVYGIQTPDLSIGRVPDGSTNWVLNSPTPNDANSAIATLGNAANLKVNEWLADPPQGEDDWIEIYNPSPLPVALGGLHLTDDLNNRTKHRIPNLSFIGSSSNAFLRFADGASASGADRISFSLRAGGEAVGIATANGTLIDGVTFSQQTLDVSEGRFPNGASNVVSFPGTASPGASNWRRLTSVAINEALTHTDLPLEDAIELRNLTAQDIDIGGWWLSDDNGTLQKYQIPAPTILLANSFVVIYENQFTNRDLAALPFALSSGGDEIVLSETTNNLLTGYRTRVDFGAADNSVSFGRYVTSDARAEFVAMSSRTFGVDDPGNVDEFRQGAGKTNAYPRVGPIVISEIMYRPPDIGATDNTQDEFVELHNISTAPVNLFDTAHPTNVWRLRDAVDFDFPQGTTIDPGGYLLVVSFDPVNNTSALAAFRAAYSLSASVAIVGPYDGRLANDTDDLELRKPDAPDLDGVPYVLVERVRYFDTAPWPIAADGTGASLQRLAVAEFGNDPINWTAAAPTPGPPSAPSDSDGDGMPDTWENTYGFDPLDPSDSGLDPDGDRLTNRQEYQAGTDPLNAQSVLRFSSLITGANGANATLSFTAAANQSYSIFWKESADAGTWAKLVDVPAQPNQRVESIIDPLPPSSSRLYRVVTPQQPGVANEMPAILKSPRAASTDFDGSASFKVHGFGMGGLAYEWMLNGSAIPNSSNSDVFAISNAQFSAAGYYSVKVTDTGGSKTSGAVYLGVKPRIMTHPQDRSATVGQMVTFTVDAQSSWPLGYRWRKNGRSIPGETNASLTLPNVQASDAGRYSVLVTHQLPGGRYGVNSSNAVFTVLAP